MPRPHSSCRRTIAALIGGAGLVIVLSASPAGAHNLAHLTLPDGSCHQVGAGNEVSRGRDGTPLDLVPETPSPLDEFGTSYAGYQGHGPLFPGPCR